MTSAAEFLLSRTRRALAVLIAVWVLLPGLTSCTDETAFETVAKDTSLGASWVVGIPDAADPVLLAGQNVIAIDERCEFSRIALLSDHYSALSVPTALGEPYCRGVRRFGRGRVYLVRSATTRITDGLGNEILVPKDDLVILDPTDPMAAASVMRGPGTIVRFAGSQEGVGGAGLAAAIWESSEDHRMVAQVSSTSGEEWQSVWSSHELEEGPGTFSDVTVVTGIDGDAYAWVLGTRDAVPNSLPVAVRVSASGDHMSVDLAEAGATGAEIIGAMPTERGTTLVVSCEKPGGEEGVLLVDETGGYRYHALPGRLIALVPDLFGEEWQLITRSSEGLSTQVLGESVEDPVVLNGSADLVIPGDTDGDGTVDLVLLKSRQAESDSPSGLPAWTIGVLPGDASPGSAAQWGPSFSKEDLLSVDLIDIDGDTALEVLVGTSLGGGEGALQILEAR